MHHGWMFRMIPRLCRTHEGMRYHVEPLYVVQCTRSRSNTNLTNRCKVFRKLNSSIINILYRKTWSSRVWRNGLHIPKLSHNPLWSVYDKRWSPSNMFEKQRNQLEFSNCTVVTIRNSAHNIRRQSIQPLLIRRHW